MYMNGGYHTKYTDECNNNDTQGRSLVSEGGGPAHTMAILHPHGAQISCVCYMEASSSYSGVYSAMATQYSGCGWQALNSLLIKTTSSGTAAFIL